MQKIIIDTDIGTDVDDMLAVAYALESGLDVALITTVHGDAKLRAQIARTFTNMLGRGDIPIAAGESSSLVLKQLYWTGVEKNITVDPQLPIREDGVDAFAECVYQNKHQINVVSIAPMTNIAKAFQRYPDLPQYINHIYIMGNAICARDLDGSEQFFLNYRSHNFKVDPHAVDIVFAADVPKTIITTDVCKKNHFASDDFDKLNKPWNSVMAYLRASWENWADYSMYDVAYLYDPLVIHHLIDDSVTEKKAYDDGKVRVTTGIDENFDFRKVLFDCLNKSGGENYGR